MPVKPICTACGSDNITADACAVWSVPDQRWEITTCYDNVDCQECGGECRTEDVTVNIETDTPCISKWESIARSRGWTSDDEPGDHDVAPSRNGRTVSSWAAACHDDNLTLDDYKEMETDNA